MDRFKEFLTRCLAGIIPFSFVKRSNPPAPLVFYYHLVSDAHVPHISSLYSYKRVNQFDDDLKFIAKHYTSIPLSEIIRHVNGEAAHSSDCFHLTFDDGLREIYDVIAPMLLRNGISATFFISSAFLDNSELCYQHKASLIVDRINRGVSLGVEARIRELLQGADRNYSLLSEGVLRVDYARRDVLNEIGEVVQLNFQGYLRENQPYLTSQQIRKLIEWGFTIGGHSIDHPYYSSLSLSEQLEQTIVSVRAIRERFNLGYGAFAFPHNDVGVPKEFFEKIHKDGLIDITFGTGGMVAAGFATHKQRVSLERPMWPARDLIARQCIRNIYRRENFRTEAKFNICR